MDDNLFNIETLTQKNKRVFPRIVSRCPVIFQLSGSQQWKVGIMDDYSANGLSLRGKEAILPGEVVKIALKPGSNRVIPAITGTGNIVRCEPLETGEYQISIKLTQVNAPKAASAEA